ncbi:MAG: hypothetical protein GY953_41230, partial [bacterium]|nr:hypothetical protein [bacterium]
MRHRRSGESRRQPLPPFLWSPRQCPTLQIRNVADHLSEESQTNIRSKLRNAYATREYADAKAALNRLWRQLMDLNPSAARSLEEGSEETLTLHRLRVPAKLLRSLASANLIESTFSTVETLCRNVRRWQGGDQYL